MNAKHEAGETRRFADGLGEFLISRDAELSVGFVRGGAGQEGAVTTVAAGVCELQAADERELIPQMRHRLQDGCRFPFSPKRGRRVVAAIHAEAPEFSEMSVEQEILVTG